MKYEILAYSPSRNELQREFDEAELKGQATTSEKEAQMKADSFASRLNKRMGEPYDWIGQIRLL
jgi:hypothetical protein